MKRLTREELDVVIDRYLTGEGVCTHRGEWDKGRRFEVWRYGFTFYAIQASSGDLWYEGFEISESAAPDFGTLVTENPPQECSKCGSLSGDDWVQCRGRCPVEGSPHYDPSVRGGLRDHRGQLHQPLVCGCHCNGGCGNPYEQCAYPCAEHAKVYHYD